MCGIVGYLGKGDAYPALIKGLKRLEYRGYDSAGIAVLGNDDIIVRKAKGAIKYLVEKITGEVVKDSKNLSKEECEKAEAEYERQIEKTADFVKGNIGIGQEVLQEKMMSVRQYLMAGVVLWCAGIPLYLEHLFLNLKFSKVISMGISIVQFLLSALFLTGLGDGRWQWFPCTWSNRGTTLYLLGAMEGPQAVPGVAEQARVCLLLGLLICAIIILWFRNYEGRECHD